MFDQSKVLGVDVSHWNKDVDWARLKTAGVVFAVIKASQGAGEQDPAFRRHLAGAQAAGLVTGAYHWCDPTCPDEAQVQNFCRAVEGLSLDFAALDVEQYWQDWAEWQRHKVISRLSPERISQSALAAAEGLRARLNKPVLIYTRSSFIQEYALPMLHWLPDWPTWLAQYPYPKNRVECSWESLKRDHLPRIYGPRIPWGCPTWTLWQFSGDRFILPGVSGTLDLNYFNGSREQLFAWVGRSLDAHALSDTQKLARLWSCHPELHQP